MLYLQRAGSSTMLLDLEEVEEEQEGELAPLIRDTPPVRAPNEKQAKIHYPVTTIFHIKPIGLEHGKSCKPDKVSTTLNVIAFKFQISDLPMRGE